jgi:hypothetical protein
MKCALMISYIALISSTSHASDVYETYESYYLSRPDAVFREPIGRRENGVSYALETEPERSFVEYVATVSGRQIGIAQSPYDIEVEGRRFIFSSATMLWDAYARPFHIGEGTEIFIAPPKGETAPALCADVGFSRSGEADRWKPSFLLLQPLGSRDGTKPTIFGIGTLFGGCRAFIRTADGRLAYPKNEYRRSKDGTRIGLRMTYYALRGNHLVPAGETVDIKFIDPENPWRFSVMPRS